MKRKEPIQMDPEEGGMMQLSPGRPAPSPSYETFQKDMLAHLRDEKSEDADEGEGP